jgi:hypothetical protein
MAGGIVADIMAGTPAKAPIPATLAPPSPVLSQIMSPVAAPTAAPLTEAQQYFERNRAFLAPGDHVYNTPLSPQEEQAFRLWLKAPTPGAMDAKAEFNADAPVTDYDMRGFWKALMAKDPRATERINRNDKAVHRPDVWKTPYDASFSAESQWADPAKAPRWNEQDQLVLPDGTVIFDERARVKAGKPVG